jgi:hypothetical protein
MKLLIIAMSGSIHVARWIRQISDQGWDIHLFPSIDDGKIHPLIENVTIYHSIFGREPHHPSVKRKGIYLPPLPYIQKTEGVIRVLWNIAFASYRARQLARVIDKIRPDLIHVIEFQHAGYLFLEARKFVKQPMPRLLITNLGSDIYLFGRLKDHRDKVKALVQAADYYDCECERDIQLAKDLGMTAKNWPVFPNTGGFDLDHIATLRQPGPVSERRLIMLKGYQGWAGRALFGLRAIEMCADMLQGYRLVTYTTNEEVMIAAELFTQRTGIPVEIIQGLSHDDILRYFGQARIYVGVNISDGISTSLLEAMVMGAFPIQTCTACADEWITDGETGLIISPEDPHVIAQALRRALVDDNLVNHAAAQNARVAAERLDSRQIKALTISLYEKTINDTL